MDCVIAPPIPGKTQQYLFVAAENSIEFPYFLRSYEEKLEILAIMGFNKEHYAAMEMKRK